MQQQTFFAQRVGALPASLNSIESRSVGLPETTARLQQQMQYWVEHDGAETTASAAGAKAAEKTRRYIQHLLDRGGASAPRCPRQSQLQSIRMKLRPELQQQARQQQQQRGNNNDGEDEDQVMYATLTDEEQCQLASLTPLSYAEALNYVPTLARFEQRDVEETLAIFRV